MATQVQHRRGTTSQHSTFTGAVGEITIDTDKDTIIVHDGGTTGGFEIVNTSTAQTLTNKTITLGGNLNLNSNDITGTGNINITGTATVSGDLTVDTNTLYVDSANNEVGIGTTSPSAKLNVYDGGINVDTTGSVLTGTRYQAGSGSANISLYKSRTNTIGDHSALINEDNIGGIITRASDGTSYIPTTAIFSKVTGSVSTNSVPSAMIFSTNSGSSTYTEALRIDSSGNVLVGTTDDAPANNSANSSADDGFVIKSDGNFQVAKYNSTPAYINRTGNDGTLIDFRKSGTTVGSIGNQVGDLYIGTGDTGISFFDFGTDNAILPYNTDTGNYADNSLNFGIPTIRWKNAYLSGNIYLGGTGSANALDDYETGTWTPASSVGAITQSANATYTKIGNRVLLQASNIRFNNSTNNEVLRITGLPFTPVGEEVGGSAIWSLMDSANQWGTVFLETGGVVFYASSVTGSFDRLRHIDLASTSATVYFQVQYRTNA